MFVVAAAQSMLRIAKKRLLNYDRDINKYVEAFCNKGLISFGLNLNSKTSRDNVFLKDRYVKNVGKFLTKYYDISKIRNSIDLFIDSGGYQVSCGYIKKELIPDFISAYTDFLNQYDFDYAFSLDIPHLPDLKTREELFNLNIRAYNLIDNILPEKRNKLYFVSHFRTTELEKVWNRIIFETDILKKYHNYAIGGLVSSQPATKRLQFNLYTLGILQIIFGLGKSLPDPFNFHILGSATAKNIIYNAMIKKHIKELFNLKEVNLTFDSSTVFSKVQMSRIFTYFDEKTKRVIDVSLKSSELDNINKFIGKTNREIVIEVLEKIFEFSNIDMKDALPSTEMIRTIYCEDTNTIHRELLPYILAMESYALNKITEYVVNDISEELYHYYKTGNDHMFMVILNNIFKTFNTKKNNTAKSISIKTSMDTISRFVEDKTKDDLLKYFETLSITLDTENTVLNNQRFII